MHEGDGAEPTDLERQRGLERPPRLGPTGVAAGVGLLWGAFSYSVLWEGTPFAVDRAFVVSVRGTLLLLPARIVLWGVHLAEELAARTFELSRSTWVLGVAAGAAGLAIGLVIGLALRGAASLVRR
jgi:hypothetical protein